MTTAGRLDIEIGANTASLQGDMRRAGDIIRSTSQQIQAGMAGAEHEVTEAGLSVRRLASEALRLKDALDPLAPAQRQYSQEVRIYNALAKTGAIDQAQYARAIEMAEAKLDQQTVAMRGAVGQTGAMRAGMQQAGFQASDFFVQISGGTDVIRAASLQLPQFTQALALMGSGSAQAEGRFASFAGFMASGWGAAVTVGISILGALATGLFSTSEESKKAERASLDLTDALDFQAMATADLIKAISELEQAQAKQNRTAYESEQLALANAEASLKAAIAKRAEAKATLQAFQAELRRTGGTDAAAADDPWAQARAIKRAAEAKAAEAEIAKIDASIGTTEKLVREAKVPVVRREIAAATDAAAAATLKFDRAERDLRTQFEAGRISERAYRSGLASLTETMRSEQEAARASERTHRERRAGLSEEEKAYKAATDAADKYLQSLRQENERFGKSAIELKRMEVAAAAAAAAEAGLTRQSLEIVKAGDQAVANMRQQAQERYAKQIKSIQDEIAVLGLVGEARARASLRLEEDAFRAQAVADGIANVDAAWRAYLETRSEQIDRQTALDRDAEAAREAEQAFARLNDTLRDAVGYMQNLGGIAGVLGGLLQGGATGVFGQLGGAGVLFDLMRAGPALGKQIEEFGLQLTEIFGLHGQLATGISEALAGATYGSVASSAVFGRNQSTGGQLGSLAGSVLGQAAGTQLLGSLGAFAGPAGAIAGALLGSIAGDLIGGLIGGHERGAAIVRGGQVAGYYGNNGEFKDQAGGLATSALDALARIAQQLGGALDPSAGVASVGIRDGKYVIDPQGRGYTKTSKYSDLIAAGTDPQAAVAILMQDLIEDGVLTGVRAGALKLIKETGDLEGGIAKALQFDAIMDALEGGSNALVQQIASVKAEFAQYIAVMKEAGATADELAQAQELQVRRIQDLIAQAGQGFRSTFYSPAQNVDFAKSQIAAALNPLGLGWIDTVAEYVAEVTAREGDTSEAGVALLGTLYELADAFGVLKDADEAAAAAAQASAAARRAEAEAARNAAEAALRQAWDRERAELERTIDARRALIDSLQAINFGLAGATTAAGSYATSLARLRQVGGMAAMGDQAAGQALAGAIADFLPAALNNAATMVEFERDRARAARYRAGAVGANEAMASEAERMLAAEEAAVRKLIDIDSGIVSLNEAMAAFVRLNGGGSAAGGRPSPAEDREPREHRRRMRDGPRVGGDPQAEREERTDRTFRALEQRMASMEAAMVSNAGHSRALLNFFEDAEAEGGGFRVQQVNP